MKKLSKQMKVGLILLGVSILVLGAMLWMPTYLAGPDGLEQVTFDLSGDNEYEPTSPLDYIYALFPDYSSNALGDGYIQNWIVGIIGTIIAFFFIMGILKLVFIKKPVIESNVPN